MTRCVMGNVKTNKRMMICWRCYLHHDDERDLEEENVLLRVTHQKDQVLNHQRRGLYEIDMTRWDDDEDVDGEDLMLQSSTHAQPAQPDSIDLAKDATHIKNPFIDP